MITTQTKKQYFRNKSVPLGLCGFLFLLGGQDGEVRKGKFLYDEMLTLFPFPHLHGDLVRD